MVKYLEKYGLQLKNNSMFWEEAVSSEIYSTERLQYYLEIKTNVFLNKFFISLEFYLTLEEYTMSL